MPSKLRESSTIASNSPASHSRSSSESFIATPSSSGGVAAAAPPAPVTVPTPKPKGRPRKKTNTNGNAELPPIPPHINQPSPPRVIPPPVRVIQPEYPIGESYGLWSPVCVFLQAFAFSYRCWGRGNGFVYGHRQRARILNTSFSFFCISPFPVASRICVLYTKFRHRTLVILF
jgi:hypothetical protein